MTLQHSDGMSQHHPQDDLASNTLPQTSMRTTTYPKTIVRY